VDVVDRILLNKMQIDFPVDPFPYRIIGKEIGIEETEAWQRVKNLKDNGIIRRLGGVFNSRRLGYKSTLCAVKATADEIPVLTKLLQGITEVTHNYLRDHVYNMWFTIVALSEERIDQIIAQVRKVQGSHEIYSLPALKVYKIGVRFEFENNNKRKMESDHPDKSLKETTDSFAYILSEKDRQLIRLLQDNLPESLRPYKDIAARLGWDETEVIDITRRLLAHQMLRRLGAVIYHQKAGFTSNAMGVWIVPEENIEQVGTKMAIFKEVSHCYRRPPTLPDWPYNLFSMVHGHSDQECEQIMARLSEVTGIRDYALLFSKCELKKTSMRYFMEEDQKQNCPYDE